MVLMVSFSCRISPRTSTVIFCDRSPLATAVVTSAMLRTCAVRLPAMELTDVGQVLPGAGHAGHLRLAAELAFGADFARHARHFGGKGVELVDHGVERVFQLENFAAHVDRDLARQVAARDGGRHLGDVADLAGEVRGHGVDASRSSPSRCRRRRAPCAWPPSLPSVPTSRATRVTSPAKALSWSTMVLMVSFSSRISPRTSTVIFFDRSPLAMAVDTSAMLRTCAVRFDAMELTRVGQVLPGAGDAGARWPDRRAGPRCRPRGRRG